MKYIGIIWTDKRAKNKESAHVRAAGMQESRATEFYLLAPNILGSTFWNSVYFYPWRLEFWDVSQI